MLDPQDIVDCVEEVVRELNPRGVGLIDMHGTDVGVDLEERIREVLALLREAQGQESAIAQCRRAYEQFEKEPTSASRELLRSAYEPVPKHLRHYRGDIYTKNRLIKAAISGENRKR